MLTSPQAPQPPPAVWSVIIWTGELSRFLRAPMSGPEMLRAHPADVRIAGLDLDIQPRQAADRIINHVTTQRWLYDYINSQCFLVTLSHTEGKTHKDRDQAVPPALQTLSRTANQISVVLHQESTANVAKRRGLCPPAFQRHRGTLRRLLTRQSGRGHAVSGDLGVFALVTDARGIGGSERWVRA